MKIDRHGKAKILTPDEIEQLFSQGLLCIRDQTLFAVMLYTACRVEECVSLKTKDVYDSKGRIREDLNIRKGSTKGKLATRTIPIIEDLRHYLKKYQPKISKEEYLFPGRWGRGHLHPEYASLIFREACKRVDIEGASTHSCRRTALTRMSNEGIPLRIIQQISGHRNLEQLQEYLDVDPAQIRGAIAALSMLTPPKDRGNKFDRVDWDNPKLSAD